MSLSSCCTSPFPSPLLICLSLLVSFLWTLITYSRLHIYVGKHHSSLQVFLPLFKIPVKRYLLTFGSVLQMHCLTFNVSQQACSACGKWLSSSHYFDWLRQAAERSRGLSLNEYLLFFFKNQSGCYVPTNTFFCVLKRNKFYWIFSFVVTGGCC